MGNSVNDVKELFKKCDTLFGMRFDVLELNKLVSKDRNIKKNSKKLNHRSDDDAMDEVANGAGCDSIPFEILTEEMKASLKVLVKNAVKEALEEVLKEKNGA